MFIIASPRKDHLIADRNLCYKLIYVLCNSLRMPSQALLFWGFTEIQAPQQSHQALLLAFLRVFILRVALVQPFQLKPSGRHTKRSPNTLPVAILHAQDKSLGYIPAMALGLTSLGLFRKKQNTLLSSDTYYTTGVLQNIAPHTNIHLSRQPNLHRQSSLSHT